MKIIYTDGSTRGNGNKNASGGFGVVVCECWGDEPVEDYVVVDAYQEFSDGTTNNREEMKAILWAMKKYGTPEAAKNNPSKIAIVYSDSMYCVNSFTNWIKGWKANGWTRSKGKKLENLDLIKEYDSLIIKGYEIDLRYIKGHNGETWNEMADKLATGKVKVEDIDLVKFIKCENLPEYDYNKLAGGN